jgi:hypothetical protein
MGMYCEVSAASASDRDRSSAPSGFLGRVIQSNVATSESVSLEKAWHGLHYLLTGETWEGEGPLAFLLAGGEPLGDEEDESPARWFSPEEAARIHEALDAVSDAQLWSRFNAEEMEQLAVYPGIWDEPAEDLQEEYLGYFHELKQLAASATQQGLGLIVTLG